MAKNRLSLKRTETKVFLPESTMAMGSLEGDRGLIFRLKNFINAVETLNGKDVKLGRWQYGDLMSSLLKQEGTLDKALRAISQGKTSSVSGFNSSIVFDAIPVETQAFLSELLDLDSEERKRKDYLDSVSRVTKALNGEDVKLGRWQYGDLMSSLLKREESLDKALRAISQGKTSSVSGFESSVVFDAIPVELRSVIADYLSCQDKPRDSEEFQSASAAFNRLQEDTLRQQNFFRLLDQETPFSEVLQYLAGLEEKDPQGRELAAILTGYAYAYRRKQFLGQIFGLLAQKEPDFDTVFAELATFAKSPAPKDKEVALTVAQQAAEYETKRLERNILCGITFEMSRDEVMAQIEAISLRPTLEGGVDYVQFVQNLKSKVNHLYDKLAPIQILAKTTTLRQQFATLTPSEVLGQIDAIPATAKRDILIKNALLEEYRRTLESGGNKVPDDLRAEINARIGVALDGEYSLLELGENDSAKQYMMENFGRTFFTLFQSLRGNPALRQKVENYIVGRDEDGGRIRNQFVQSIKQLEQQRPLTDIERAYVESVEQLTKFNPYIVGLANEALGITDEFLRNHFDTLSSRTWENLSDGSYLPMLQVGTGPNGLSFFGEITRYQPDLAAQTLIIDQGKQPGGPFAVPGGPAWELNSANRRGKRQAVLPDAPGKNEAQTVRAYGSPVTRWYPGERRQDEDVRAGGINTTVDYLPTPDELSTLRYPTNEEFQIILVSQSAMLFRQCTLQTSLDKVERNTDESQEGQYKVTLTRTMSDGSTETKTVFTDSVINAAGLGEDFLGFTLEGSRAETVLEATAEVSGFPKISSTLGAFAALADRRLENAKPPTTIVMNGTGNSTDVMIEYLAELFASGNPLVRNVEKIYIVGTGELSKRPRYARINDVKGRNGKGNLIEFISGRVGDVGFVDENTDNPAQEPLLIYGENNQPLTDNDGQVITADAFIGNAGFRSRQDEVYADFLDGNESLRIKATDRPTEPISLPTNQKVSVAEALENDPNIVFVGTASNPNFDSVEKLAQLPVSAREALLRNGAENAVAVGFRAPDSQAAARLFLDNRDLDLPEPNSGILKEITLASEMKDNLSSWSVPVNVNPEALAVANNVNSEDDMLSALASYGFADIKLLDSEKKGVTGSLELSVIPNGDQLEIMVNNADFPVTPDLQSKISDFVNNTYFQNYALSGFKKKRRNPEVDIVLNFRNGCIRPRNSLVQIS